MFITGLQVPSTTTTALGTPAPCLHLAANNPGVDFHSWKQQLYAGSPQVTIPQENPNIELQRLKLYHKQQTRFSRFSNIKLNSCSQPLSGQCFNDPITTDRWETTSNKTQKYSEKLTFQYIGPYVHYNRHQYGVIFVITTQGKNSLQALKEGTRDPAGNIFHWNCCFPFTAT